MKKIYENDLEQSRMIAQLVESKLIKKHVSIQDSTLSRFKNQKNPNWQTIQSLINLPIPADLKGMLDYFLQASYEQLDDIIKRLNFQHPSWLNHIAVQLKTQEELNKLRYIIKTFNIKGKPANNLLSFNILSIKDNKNIKVDTNVDKFIEKVYDTFFNIDKIRNDFKVENSLLLDRQFNDDEERHCLLNRQFRQDFCGYTSLSTVFKGESLAKQKASLALLLINNYQYLREETISQHKLYFLEEGSVCIEIKDIIYDQLSENEYSHISLEKTCLHPELIPLLLDFGFTENTDCLVFNILNMVEV